MSKTTHIICILDRSGSMAGIADEVRTNFNHFLKEQQELEGKAKLTLVLFDDKYELIYDEVNLQKAKPLTSDMYYARGMTAMNDAIGRTLTNKTRKKKAIVFIHTDGHENSSREYTGKDIKKLVKKLENKWEFIFVGAGVDAMAKNKDYGFRHTLNASNNAKSYGNQYDMFGAATSCYRSTGVAGSAQTMNIVAEAQEKEILDSAGNPIEGRIADLISTTTTTITSE